ncbi:MAG: hypothetical protein WHW07_08160 [Bacteroidales bacterium]|jgi:hypothetical protein|nr:hypothetical protein [Flavobacterium piscis]
MKKIILLVIVTMCFSFLYSQENNSNISFKILTGAKYTPFDYVGGGILGFSITKNKFSFSFRNDISLSIVKDNASSYFGINKYRTYKYFDIHYSLSKKIGASLGYGWISNKDEIHILHNYYGYSVISLGVRYFISETIIFEFKGDIPFVDLHSPVDQNVAFPASIGLIYVLK